MIALSVLSLLLATTSLAAPMRRDNTGTYHGACGAPAAASGITLPTTFTQVETAVIVVVLAVGTQNYYCNSEGTYEHVGAQAQLYDMSCMSDSQTFSSITNDAYNRWNTNQWTNDPSGYYSQPTESSNVTVSGQFSMNSTQQQNGDNGVLVPVWNMRSTEDITVEEIVVVIIVGDEVQIAPSSSGTQNINWAEYKTSGGWVNTMYSVETQGGNPPTNTCTPGSYESSKYTAIYMGY